MGAIACRRGTPARTPCRRLQAALLGGLLAAPSWAAPTLPELGDVVLALDRDIKAEVAPRNGERLAIDVGNRVDDLLLRQVRLQIDDAAWLEHRYSDREALALRGQALHPFHVATLSPGPHRLRAEFIARHKDAPPGTVRVHAQLEQQLQAPLAGGHVELLLDGQGWRDKAALSLVDGSAAAATAAGLRRADFLLASGQPLSALVELQDPALAADAAAAPRREAALQALGYTAAPAPAGGVERYNQAITHLPDAGAQALDTLGSAEARDAQAWALRDLANLSLGYHWLRQGEGEKARPVLARVRSPGPCGNAALLGFGWSFLVPAGVEQPAMFAAAAPLWPDSAEDAARLRRSLPFRYLHSVAVGGERLLDLRRALVPWIELIGRDVTDPAVQEGLLVVPYALAHLGAHAQARQYSERAVQQLQQAQAELDDSIRQVQEGRLLRLLRERPANRHDGWQRELADLRSADATAWIAQLAERDDILAAIDGQLQLQQYALLLDGDAAQLQDHAAAAPLQARLTALRAQVEAAAQQQGRQLEALALDQLRQRREHTLRLLAEAHLVLARIHDRPLEGEPS